MTNSIGAGVAAEEFPNPTPKPPDFGPKKGKAKMHIHSYSTVYALGHRAITDLLQGPVVVEEKVDGSQFSMSNTNGELACRSKGQDLIIDAPEKMFTIAVETAKSLDLKEGWVYRCEYLNKPKHNTLAYSRVPVGNLVIYDVETGPQCFLSIIRKRGMYG